jgi:hypothetical protein
LGSSLLVLQTQPGFLICWSLFNENHSYWYRLCRSGDRHLSG